MYIILDVFSEAVEPITVALSQSGVAKSSF